MLCLLFCGEKKGVVRRKRAAFQQAAAIPVAGVQHRLGHLVEGLTVEFLVDLFDLRVLVAGAQLHGDVPPVKGGNALFAGFVRIPHDVLGLNAADVAAGAGHDLHEMVLPAAFLHTLQEGPGVGSAVNHRNLKRLVADCRLSLPHALVPANRGQVQQALGGAFAGVAEDHARAGGLTHQGIVGGILQRIPVHAFGLCPAGQLPGGDYLIGVPQAGNAQMIRGAVQLSATNFKLLGSAGGERHMHDLFRIQSHLFGKIGFHRGPLHADGALCGG